ncbi:hypothetical protein [Rhizobium sp. AG207R]|uniref:hypothetical protein n=1 Tax=Rhizobium sp. AG207R TaxID=2802287 RepID=UPI0022AC0CE7|nr:hypothetical protein [Rhizobium sp. AG207R]MCZ3377433.1 hypothetical protein [Rhizobium sp. AG207R]
MRLGLFIYGAMLMAMCFVTGLYLSSHYLVGLALISCAFAALAHVFHECADFCDETGKYAALARLQIFAAGAAITSWLMTAITVFYVLLILIGGA